MRFVPASKWIAAAALAFALALPFTTCQSHGATNAITSGSREKHERNERQQKFGHRDGLSVADLVVIFRGRRRDLAHIPRVLVAE